MKILFVLILFLSIIKVRSQTSDSLVLVKNGKPNYNIQVESVHANPAMLLLQSYVDSISGAHLIISKENTIKMSSV